MTLIKLSNCQKHHVNVICIKYLENFIKNDKQ